MPLTKRTDTSPTTTPNGRKESSENIESTDSWGAWMDKFDKLDKLERVGHVWGRCLRAESCNVCVTD